jgi:hypothetical protein
VTERGGQRHPVDVAAGRGLRRVEVAVGIDPQHGAGPAGGGREAAEGAQRDRVVAAEHDRQAPLPHRVADAPGDALAGAAYLRQEARPRIAARRRLGHGGLDVAPVRAVAPERGQPLLETRVADRRRAHVDAAAAGTEVERCTDDRYPALGHV